MFAFKPRKKVETAFRMVLIAVMYFNAFVPITGLTPTALAQGSGPTSTETITETPTSEPTVTPTETPQPVTETATPSPTAAVTETPVPSTPEVSPTSKVENPVLSLSTDTKLINPGGEFALHWTIEGITVDEHKLVLIITLPTGFSLQDPYEGTFDDATRALTQAVATPSGQILLTANDFTSDVTFEAQVLENDEVLAKASLFLPFQEQFAMDANGGVIEAQGGEIKVEFPAGVLTEKAVIQIGKPSGDEIPDYPLLGGSFEITAYGQDSGQELKHFDKDLFLYVSYADLNIPPEQEDNLHVYWFNEELQGWEPLVTAVNKETRTLEARTDHFTVFDVNIDHWQASHLPTVEDFQVSTFTGAGTYSLPLQVPAGPGGLQPNLTLTYNSQIVDQATLAMQASWVGMGWSLDTGSIEVNKHGTDTEGDDTYSLSVAGMSTQIVKDTSGVYHTADENFWKITRNGNTSWTVKDKQGNTYYFEETSTYPYQVGTCQQENAGVAWGTYRWSLSKVENIFGQQILYTYTKEEKSVGISVYTGWCPQQAFNGVIATYPSTITYAGGKYRVRFALEGRADYSLLQNAGPGFSTYERSRLSKIYVEQDIDGQSGFETVLRRYDFTYKGDNESDLIFPGYWWNVINGVSTGKTTTLKSVQEFGVGAAAGLPAVTFTYGDNLHLTKANNGYGGSVEFSYGLWYYYLNARKSQTKEVKFGTAGYACYKDDWFGWGPLPGGDVNCGAQPGDPLIIKNPLNVWGAGTYMAYMGTNTPAWVQPGGVYRVAAGVNLLNRLSYSLGVDSGAGQVFPAAGDPTDIIKLPVTASLATPIVLFSGGSGVAFLSYYKIQRLTSIYRVTTKQVKDGNNHTYTYTYSYLNDSGVDTARVNDEVLSPTGTGTCDPANTSCYEASERYSEFRGHAQVTETGPDGVTKTITRFQQDDLLKGRPISTTVKVGAQTLSETVYTDVTTPLSLYLPPNWVGFYRTWIYTSAVENRIYANDGTYSATKTLYTYDSTYGNLLTQTEQSWNAGTWTTYRSTEHNYFPNDSPTRYLVSLPGRVRSLDVAGNVLVSTLFLYDGNIGDYQIPPADGKLTAVRTRVSTDGVQWSQVSYGYDSWGNRTGITTYSGYGTWNTAPTTSPLTTTTVYDSTFHVYPISQTTPGVPNALNGLITTWNYDYDGNSVDDYVLGVPTKETDPNGNQTSAQYDTFGRILNLIRPGDSTSSPTLTIGYQDSFPFTTTITQKINATQSYTVQRIYDGMGRQTKIVSGGITTDTIYDSATVTRQSIPYAAGETVSYTTTTVTPATRTTTVSAPDGATTTTVADGLTGIVTDALGNSTLTTNDVWGRAVSVTPPSGPALAYTYDPMDRLTSVVRGSGLSLPAPTEANPGTTGLVSWWTLNETSGTRNDSFGTSHLTDNNTVTSTGGKQGNAADFVAANTEYLSVAENASLSVGDVDFSVCGWYYLKDLNDNRLFSQWDAPTNNRSYQILYSPAWGNFGLQVSPDGTSNSMPAVIWSGASPSANQWYYVCAWHDATANKLGIQVNNGVVTTLDHAAGVYDSQANIVIGAGFINPAPLYSNSRADEVALYKRVLTAAERSWLYNNGAGRTYSDLLSANPGTGSLAAWWKLNETGGTRYDSQGTNTLTDNNTVLSTTGLKGNAASFVAANQEYLSMADNPSISGGDVDFTIVANVYLNNNTGNFVILDKSSDSATSAFVDYRLAHNPGTGFRFRASSTVYVDSGAVSANAWHTVILWHDSVNNTINIQVDNGVINTVAFSGGTSDTTYPLTIGAFAGGTAPLDGRLDEVALYKRVLTPAERTWLHNDGAGRTYSDLTPPPTPPAPTTTTLTYDHAGRKLTMSDPDMGSWSYVYDALGNLTRQTDARGQRICLYYDSLNRLMGKHYRTDDNCPTTPTYDVSYAYDVGTNGKGLRTGMTDASGSATWTYDTRGRLASESKVLTGVGTFNTSWQYNSADLPTSMTYPGGSGGQAGEVVTFGYNSRMLLDSVIGTSTYVSSTTYDSAGRIDLRAFGNTTQTDYVYYPWTTAGQGGRLQYLKSGTAGTPTSLQNLTYTYDPVGNISTILDSLAGPQTQTYGYDALDRLTTASATGGTVGLYNETYTYDPASGNLASKAGTNLVYNEQVTCSVGTRTIPHAVSAMGSNSYDYDCNGNQITRNVNGQYTLGYDAENQLVSVTGPALTASFVYDGDGRRVKSTVNGTTTTFIGTHYEVTGSQVTKYYFAGTQRVAMRKYTIPQPMVVEYFLGDHLGSTSITTDNTGAKVSEMRYKPWGEVRSWWTSAVFSTPAYKLPDYTFTGQFSHMDDPSTGATEGFGLMFYQSRMYDPAIGRFTSADSIVPNNIHGYDRYNYVSNRPTIMTDPTGHMEWNDNEGTRPKPPCAKEATRNAKSNMDKISISKTSSLDTYTSAQIGVQNPWKDRPHLPLWAGQGIAKLHEAELTTPYGEDINNADGTPRYHGLLKDHPLDPYNAADAIVAMTTRIQTRLDACQKTKFACTTTDIFLGAALGGDNAMTFGDLKDLGNGKVYGEPNADTGIFNWNGYLDGAENRDHNLDVIQKFVNNVSYLQQQGAAVPDVKWTYVCGLLKK